MGLFSSSEEITVIPHGSVRVDQSVADRLPDAGERLLMLLGDLSEQSYADTATEISRVRHANGGLPRAALADVGIRDWKSGPLTLLVWLTVKETLLTSVWASFGLGRKERKSFDGTIAEIIRGQGVPAAATWALASRPAGKLDVGFLAEQLSDAHDESAAMITNGDVIKAFRKWRR